MVGKGFDDREHAVGAEAVVREAEHREATVLAQALRERACRADVDLTAVEDERAECHARLKRVPASELGARLRARARYEGEG